MKYAEEHGIDEDVSSVFDTSSGGTIKERRKYLEMRLEADKYYYNRQSAVEKRVEEILKSKYGETIISDLDEANMKRGRLAAAASVVIPLSALGIYAAINGI